MDRKFGNEDLLADGQKNNSGSAAKKTRLLPECFGWRNSFSKAYEKKKSFFKLKSARPDKKILRSVIREHLNLHPHVF